MNCKNYQNVSYKELLSYSQNNPNRTRELESIEIHVKPDLSLKKIGLPHFNSMNLNPSGMISLITCINDPTYYSLASISARTQLIMDTTTKLQAKTDDLKNTSLGRKRKKIRELISSAYNGSPLEDKDYYDLFNGLSMIRNIQFILIKSNPENIETNGLKGEIVFGSNPTNWKIDVPIWIVDYRILFLLLIRLILYFPDLILLE